MPAGKASNTSSTLSTDQAAAKQADATATKAAALLASDEKAKATTKVIQADQSAVKAANVALQEADAKVQADGEETSALNVTA